MRTQQMIIGAAVVLLVPVGADGEFAGVTIVRLDCTECIKTYRVYAHLDDPADRLLAIGTDDGVPLRLLADAPFVNDGGSFDGLKSEDFAGEPFSGPRDTWVTIGHDEFAGNDTNYSPGFLGSDGTHAVLTGTGFLEDNGGWFDNPPLKDHGPEVLIAQFSFEGHFTFMLFGGTVAYVDPQGSIRTEPFEVTYVETKFLCPADVDLDYEVGFTDLLAVLTSWGPCFCCLTDVDHDGTVGLSDLLAVLDAWGKCV